MKKIPPSRPSGFWPRIQKANVISREAGIEALQKELGCTYDEAVAEWEKIEDAETQPNHKLQKPPEG